MPKSKQPPAKQAQSAPPAASPVKPPGASENKSTGPKAPGAAPAKGAAKGKGKSGVKAAASPADAKGDDAVEVQSEAGRPPRAAKTAARANIASVTGAAPPAGLPAAAADPAPGVPQNRRARRAAARAKLAAADGGILPADVAAAQVGALVHALPVGRGGAGGDDVEVDHDYVPRRRNSRGEVIEAVDADDAVSSAPSSDAGDDVDGAPAAAVSDDDDDSSWADDHKDDVSDPELTSPRVHRRSRRGERKILVDLPEAPGAPYDPDCVCGPDLWRTTEAAMDAALEETAAANQTGKRSHSYKEQAVLFAVATMLKRGQIASAYELVARRALGIGSVTRGFAWDVVDAATAPMLERIGGSVQLPLHARQALRRQQRDDLALADRRHRASQESSRKSSSSGGGAARPAAKK